MHTLTVSLVQDLKAGKPNAYQELVRDYQSRVFNTCLGFVYNSQDAEDLTQEVFVEVYKSIKKFQGKSKLSTWIYRISVTKSLELIRMRGRKKRSGQMFSLTDLNEKGFDLKGCQGDHPGVQMENKDRSQALLQALSKLPENQRVAFTLNKVDGSSYQEVAKIMGTSLGSVESLIFRARKNLQKQLAYFYKTHG